MGELATVGVGEPQVTSDVDKLEQVYMLLSIWLQVGSNQLSRGLDPTSLFVCYTKTVLYGIVDALPAVPQPFSHAPTGVYVVLFCSATKIMMANRKKCGRRMVSNVSLQLEVYAFEITF